MNAALNALRAFSRELFFGADGESDIAKVQARHMDLNHVRAADGGVKRMAPYLPYLAYIADEKLFVNAHNTLGFCIEAMPQTGANDLTVNVLSAIYAKCPKDTGIQFHMLLSSNIRSFISKYGNERVGDDDQEEKSLPYGRPARNDNIFRRFARRRAAHFLKASQRSLTKGFPYVLRDFRLVVSFNIPGQASNPVDVQRVLDIRDTALNAFTAAGIVVDTMDVDAFLGFTREMARFEHSVGESATLPRRDAPYDNSRPLRDQIFSADRLYVEQASRILSFAPNEDEKRRDPAVVHMLSLRDYPEEKGLWEMGQIIGHMFNSAFQYPSPTLLSMGVHILDPEKARAWVIANQARATQNARSDMAKLMPDIPKKKQEWDAAANVLDVGGTMVSMYHHIAVWARPDKGLDAENIASSVWKAEGFTTINAQLHQMPAFLASLPMTLSKPFHEDMKRLGLVTTKSNLNAIHLAPLVAEWKGVGNPVLAFGGRRGQTIGLDIFANETGNYNANIVGTSGTGKSTFLQDLLWSYAASGTQVFAYDLGRSQERLCKVLGGTYVDIGSDESQCYNPFTSVQDIMEDVAIIKALCAIMASPRGHLDDYQYQALETAILIAFGKFGNDCTITNVAEVLETGRLRDQEATVDRRLTDMAVMLEPYTKRGAYARYFEGRATFDFKADFYVFENESLIRKPDLHAVLTLLSLYNITGAMFLNRNRRKIFSIDEFKQQLAGAGANTPYMADAVSAASLRARKYGGGIITATQFPEHYYDSPAGLAAWNAADWKFLSRLNAENLDALKASGRMNPSDYKRKIYGSLTLVANAYSEWYVSSPIGEGVVRSIIDPYTLLLFSNKQSDNAPLDDLIAQGYSIDEAVDAVLRQRGVIQ